MRSQEILNEALVLGDKEAVQSLNDLPMERFEFVVKHFHGKLIEKTILSAYKQEQLTLDKHEMVRMDFRWFNYKWMN